MFSRIYYVWFNCGKRNGYVKYFGVPYRDGLYNVRIPVGAPVDVITVDSAKDLPEGVGYSSILEAPAVRFDGYDVRMVDGRYYVVIDGKRFGVHEVVAKTVIEML